MPVKTEPFDIGDEVIFWVEFENAAGVPTTPSAATLQIETPDGNELPTLHLADFDQPTPGRLEYAYTIVQAGRHRFRWAATGAIQIARPGSFQVNRSALTTPAP